MATSSQKYTWTDEQQEVISEHREFYMEMVNFLNKVETEGPPKAFPQKPKTNLKQIIKGKKTTCAGKLTQEELHNYLVQNFVDVQKIIDRDIFLFKPEVATKDEAAEKLKDGFKILKRQNAQTLFFYIQYGMLLNVFYKNFFKQRIQGRITITWSKWLLENIGIQPSYARRLRDCAKSLGGYFHLYRVGLSFTEIYRRKKELLALFTSSPEMAKFWKEDPGIFPTAEMESSQTVMVPSMEIAEDTSTTAVSETLAH